jgi:hypothetical protein
MLASQRTRLQAAVTVFKAYDKLRVERMNQRQLGARLKKAAEAEKEEKK